MSRPPAEIIVSTDVNNQFGIDILKARGQWTIVYKNEPINIKYRYWTVAGEIPKYLRSSYTNQRSAESRAKKLNEHFMTEDFTVRKTI